MNKKIFSRGMLQHSIHNSKHASFLKSYDRLKIWTTSFANTFASEWKYNTRDAHIVTSLLHSPLGRGRGLSTMSSFPGLPLGCQMKPNTKSCMLNTKSCMLTVILLQFAMVSPRTRFMKNHGSQSKTNESSPKAMGPILKMPKP